MDDFNKIFGSLGMFEKAMSRANSLNSIVALSNPLMMSNWVQPKNDLSLTAMTGSALDLWQAIVNVPKAPENRFISTFMGSGGLYNNLPKSSPVLDTTAVLLGSSMSWHQLAANYRDITNNWSKTFVTNTALDRLSKSHFTNTWYSPNTIWTNYISTQPKSKEHEKDETIIETIERFADNVANVYSEIENFDETQKNKFASNISDVLSYEVQAADGISYSLVLDWILNKYNSVIESAIVTNNVAALKKIYSDLKAITIVGWVAIIVSTAAFGIVENQASKLFESVTSTTDEVSQVTYNIAAAYNAETNSPRTLRIEPDGRTKIICTIPDCTRVQLGEIVDKYVHVTFLNNGSLTKGWCLNKEFTELP